METKQLIEDKEAFDSLCWLIGISNAGKEAADVLRLLMQKNAQLMQRNKELYDKLAHLQKLSTPSDFIENRCKHLESVVVSFQQMLGDLLAIINRDDGQHTDEHGWKESTRLAILAWQDFRIIIDQLNFEVESRTKERDTAETVISNINKVITDNNLDLADKNQSITKIIGKFYE